MSKKPVFVWMDLETTGLTDESEIIEVAMVITDESLTEGMSWHEVRSPSAVGRQQILNDPYVLEMHKTSGLWEHLTLLDGTTGRDLGMIDHTLSQIVEGSRGQFGPDCEFYLAGSGVASFDRRFIRRDFPRLNALLHYSALDMGIVSRAVKFLWGEPLAKPMNLRPHRAMDDTRAAIETARTFRALGIQPSPDLTEVNSVS